LKKVSSFVPEVGKKLAQYNGVEIIDRIGEETIKAVVFSILNGSNVRSLTEGLTRKRLALSNASLLVTYLNASKSIENFTENLPLIVAEELKAARLSKEEKIYLQWLIGLTGKSIQNVLRSDADEVNNYLKELDLALKNSANEALNIFGPLIGTLKIKESEMQLSWPAITNIFMAIGAQTLAIRGAEKSMYGKLFEKLILGSMLSILGFQQIKNNDTTKKEKVFWLSERGEKRESDATLLIKPGVGIRFDIGFIGPGNTEISLDKVSRFEREMEFGRKNYFMSTIILVDRIGEKSRIVELAKRIDGNIIQMSMSNWVKHVAEVLNKSVDYKHPIIKMNGVQVSNYIRSEMDKISLKNFI